MKKYTFDPLLFRDLTENTTMLERYVIRILIDYFNDIKFVSFDDSILNESFLELLNQRDKIEFYKYFSNEKSINSLRKNVEFVFEKMIKKTKNKIPHSTLKPSELETNIWLDFIEHRNKKKAIVTKRVIEKIILESKKAGMSLNDSFSTMVERGWSSFKSEWVLNSNLNLKNKSEFQKIQYSDSELKDFF